MRDDRSAPARRPRRGVVVKDPPEIGSAEWARLMSASKIPAVMGTSPWDSRFSLWHTMAGTIGRAEQTEVQERGHYIEPALAAWWADHHPDHTVTAGLAWRHRSLTWATASPDRLAYRDDGTLELLECKTAGDRHEWGAAGTDEIPAGYRDQVMWQLGVTGARVCHVAVLAAHLGFVAYVVPYSLGHFRRLTTAAAAFMATLPGRAAEQVPDIDAHTSTYEAVRRLHPGIEDVDEEISVELAYGYRRADEFERMYAEAKREKAAQISDVIGNARRAVLPDGRVVATRRPGRNGGPPFLQINREKES